MWWWQGLATGGAPSALALVISTEMVPEAYIPRPVLRHGVGISALPRNPQGLEFMKDFPKVT
jgi:hypothetical protein